MPASPGRRMPQRLVLAALIALLMLLHTGRPSAAAAGAWAASTGPVTVVAAGRSYRSGALSPPRPALVAEAVITRVSWRFSVSDGRPVRAWLCSGGYCSEIAGQRGSSTALAGHAAARPLQFRFELGSGERRAAEVGELQVLVNYQ